MRPLDGLVVLDLTRLLPGAAATALLAAFGAEVIKIEEPGSGDYARLMPPFLDGQGAVFHWTNRGKKSVALNLKDERGKDAFLRLAGRADAVIEGFRPGVMDRLGLGYAALRARNERLIYVALTGYGQSGPYAGLAGHDINYLALGGVLDLIGARGGPPAIPGVQIADLAGGAMQAVIGLLLALAARERNGRGQLVDVSMLDGVMSLLALPLACHAATGEPPRRGAEALSGHYACYNLYQARDGRWISVGALEPKFWAELCRALGCEQFIAAQFTDARQPEIIVRLGEIFRTRDAEEWFAFFRTRDACVAPVRTVPEVAPEVRLGPKLSDTPGQPAARPPRLGEHTKEVLRWAGLTEEEADALAP